MDAKDQAEVETPRRTPSISPFRFVVFVPRCGQATKSQQDRRNPVDASLPKLNQIEIDLYMCRIVLAAIFLNGGRPELTTSLARKTTTEVHEEIVGDRCFSDVRLLLTVRRRVRTGLVYG